MEGLSRVPRAPSSWATAARRHGASWPPCRLWPGSRARDRPSPRPTARGRSPCRRQHQAPCRRTTSVLRLAPKRRRSIPPRCRLLLAPCGGCRHRLLAAWLPPLWTPQRLSRPLHVMSSSRGAPHWRRLWCLAPLQRPWGAAWSAKSTVEAMARLTTGLPLLQRQAWTPSYSRGIRRSRSHTPPCCRGCHSHSRGATPACNRTQ
mmetsp:Transcript_65914/g.204439  ORF Transcript_65914/g.204439 Transcript_65914/m.204439 type:complete len:204 (+) Transcript_65914:642-1253(+)